MAELSARQIALTALRLWRKEKHFADFIISGLLTKTELNASDRGFALELFYGVLRNLTLLDFWIGCVRASGIDRDLRDILRCGLYQLLFLKTAEHAAVHETVDLAPKRQRTVVNAILRAATRQRPESRPLRDHSMFVQFNSLPSSALERGHCYIQDPSTTVACELLDPKPGERILDATAAPGGKTGYIAQLMENLGIIVACDRDPQRLDTLKGNMACLGVGIAQILQHDWTGKRVPPEITSVAPFDRILIDAPCSNTGVMRRRVDVKWRLRASDFLRMQQRQIEIVRALVRLLKPNGLLVYSTCSLEPEENEEAVRPPKAQNSFAAWGNAPGK